MTEELKRPDRYDMREDGTGGWIIHDNYTGRTAEVNGAPLIGLQLEEAEGVIDLLTVEYISIRGETAQ